MMRDDTTNDDVELEDDVFVKSERSDTDRNLNVADRRLSTRRRELLALATGSFASLAGCSDLLQEAKREVSSSRGGMETEEPVDGTTAEEINVDQGSELNGMIATRKSYSQETPDLSPQPKPQLNAPEIDIKDEEKRFIAAPVDDVVADRVVIFNPEGPNSDTQRRVVLATLGAPFNQRQASTSIDGNRVDFSGGTVDNTEVVAGVATIQDVGECVLVARGDEEEALGVALDGFDEFVAKRFG